MKKLIYIFLSFLFAGATGQSLSQDPNHLEWIVGQWERTDMSPDQQGSEVWEKSGPNEWTGIGISTENGDTTFMENLKIRPIGGQFYYIVDVPSNSDSVKFRITELRPGFFVAANPDHDFPKEIRYELKGAGMFAEISGDGKVIPFVFERRE